MSQTLYTTAPRHTWWVHPRRPLFIVAAIGVGIALILLAVITSRVASEESTHMTTNPRSSNNTSSQVTVETNSQNHTAPAAGQAAKTNANPEPSAANEPASNSDVRVTVNGETVPVPTQGTVHRTMLSADGQTSVDVSATSDGESSNSSSSSVNVNVSTNSSSFTSNSSSTVTIGGAAESN